MPETVEEHIAARKAIADAQMEEQGPIGQLFNRAGLIAADSADRIKAPFDNTAGAFVSGAADGALHGALLSGVAWMLLVAASIVTSGAAFAPFAIAAIAGMALYKGAQRAARYQEHKYDKDMPDRLAERLGTVPMQISGRDRQNQIDYIEYEQNHHQARELERMARQRQQRSHR